MKELLTTMFKEFVIIIAGTTVATALFCTVFIPDADLGIEILWQIIALAFLTTLPLFVFYSKKELTKKQMFLRRLLHSVLLVAILIYCAYAWGWIDPASILQPIVFIALAVLVYALVVFATFQRDRKTAERLNKRLKKLKTEE